MLSSLKGVFWLLKTINKHPLTSNYKLKTVLKALIIFIKIIIKNKIEIKWINNKKIIINGLKDYSSIFNYLFILFDFKEMKFLSKILNSNITFIDIGANSGVYSVLASSYCKNIYSFEPNINVFKDLKKNLKINKIKNKCLNLGIGKNNSIQRVTKNLGDKNYILKKFDKNIPSYKIKIKNLDFFKFKKKKLVIKIDVEGYELDVLMGSIKTFYQNKLIVIIIEMNGKKSNLKKIEHFFKINKFINVNFDLNKNKIFPKSQISNFNEIYTNNLSLLQKLFNENDNNIIYDNNII